MSRWSVSPAVVRNRENGVSVKVQLEQVSRPSTSVLTSRRDIKAPLIINSSHPAGRRDQHPAIPPPRPVSKVNKNINIDSALSLTL